MFKKHWKGSEKGHICIKEFFSEWSDVYWYIMCVFVGSADHHIFLKNILIIFQFARKWNRIYGISTIINKK